MSQPGLVCFECARQYREREPEGSRAISVWLGVCDVCGKETQVAPGRDFGRLRPEWEQHRTIGA